MTIYNVGIAGFGIVGKRRKACIDKNPNLKLVAVCDRLYEQEKIMGGVKYLTSYNALMRQNLDIVFICLTNDVAADAVILGLQSGKHVFCEKPPGRNVEDIVRVRAQEKLNKGLKLMYGFNHRYHESVKEALNILRSGKLGSVINMRGIYGKSKLITFSQSDWRTSRNIAGGGVLLDQGIHMVDLMRLFGGEFTDVYSFISNGCWGYDVEDNAYALMRSQNGAIGMLHSSATQWRHRFHLDINLQKGSLILGGILSGTKSYGAETLTIVEADPHNDNGDPKETIIKYNKDPSWDDEINEFVNCILGDTKVSNGSSFDALKTMELVNRIYYQDRSWREKYKIKNSTNYMGDE